MCGCCERGEIIVITRAEIYKWPGGLMNLAMALDIKYTIICPVKKLLAGGVTCQYTFNVLRLKL